MGGALMRASLLALTISAASVACAGGQSSSPTTTSPASTPKAPAQGTTEGYDALLTGYAYPYEVSYRQFEAQRQPLRMAYMDVAPAQPNGRTVLLLHGKNFSGAYWERTIAHLVNRGYRVIAPDQIGFGKSTKPERFQFTFQALATHTRDLLVALGVNEVAVVGHSMGGMLATRFALMFPDRTASLALVNPIGLEDWRRMVPYQPIDAWYRQSLAATPESIKSYMESSYFDGQWKPAYAPLVDIQAGWVEGPDEELIAWVSALTYDMIFTQPVVYDFPRVAVPTLLIIGDRDRTALGKGQVSPEVAETMGRYDVLGERAAAAIPGAKLVELEGVGHVPMFEAWDAYITALTAFLEPTGDPPATEGEAP